jgi:hypothetical protein
VAKNCGGLLRSLCETGPVDGQLLYLVKFSTGTLMLMLNPDHSPEEVPEETEGAPEHQGPSFEDLMMLVFSAPMCFECLVV